MACLLQWQSLGGSAAPSLTLACLRTARDRATHITNGLNKLPPRGTPVDKPAAVAAAKELLQAVMVHTPAMTLALLTRLAELLRAEAPGVLHLLRVFLCIDEAEYQAVVSKICWLVFSTDTDAFIAWKAVYFHARECVSAATVRRQVSVATPRLLSVARGDVTGALMC